MPSKQSNFQVHRVLNRAQAAQVIKYGVMERRDALQDLCEWDQLYVAGRLHKPVLTLAADAAIVRAQRINLRSAAAAALLLLPAAFHTPQLHRALCGISYRGAPRHAFVSVMLSCHLHPCVVAASSAHVSNHGTASPRQHLSLLPSCV